MTMHPTNVIQRKIGEETAKTGFFRHLKTTTIIPIVLTAQTTEIHRIANLEIQEEEA
jgi:hypothetical protein